MTQSAAAQFLDGKSAIRRNALVAIDGAVLTITDELGASLAVWPLAELRQIGQPAPDGAMRFARVAQPARVTVSDIAFLARLKAVSPNLRRDAYRAGGGQWRPVLFWAIGALASLAMFFFVLLPVFADRIAAVFPSGVEQRLGENTAVALIAQFGKVGPRRGGGVCHTPQGDAALTRLAAALVDPQISPPPTIRVVDTSTSNALALPGGQILILRGLLDEATHPNAVAGVLAHELGHWEYRHPIRGYIARSGAGLMLSLISGDFLGVSAGAIVLSLAATGYYSRDMEDEADTRAIELMRRAGFAFEPYEAFFNRLAARDSRIPGLALLSLVATHPPSAGRAAKVHAAAATGGAPALSDSDWRALKAICG